jgi:hypothetical protein
VFPEHPAGGFQRQRPCLLYRNTPDQQPVRQPRSINKSNSQFSMFSSASRFTGPSPAFAALFRHQPNYARSQSRPPSPITVRSHSTQGAALTVQVLAFPTGRVALPTRTLNSSPRRLPPHSFRTTHANDPGASDSSTSRRRFVMCRRCAGKLGASGHHVQAARRPVADQYGDRVRSCLQSNRRPIPECVTVHYPSLPTTLRHNYEVDPIREVLKLPEDSGGDFRGGPLRRN